jgi:hypothetical protein
MHEADESGEIHGDPARHNELPGGHGDDVVHAGFGRGEIHCGPGATVFLSHRSRRLYKLDGCRRISYRTLGY